jgi:fibronectin-binding autotransporter adhesin
MTFRQQLAIVTAIGALLPFSAQAANPDAWSGATSNAWETPGNWSAGAPTTTSAVTISNLANNPVQLNSNVSLNATSGTNIGSLTVGTGVAPGTANVLNINLGDTLTMGTHAVTLDGGSITGSGTLSATGTISGYGTISSQVSGTSFSATATNGNAFGGFSPFVNGTPGTAITLIGQNNLTSDSFAISNHGDFNFQGVTLTTPTLSGVSTNLNAGSAGGNNYYGQLSFTGAASTVVGAVNNTNYQQFKVTGTTVNLSNFSLVNSWATNVPAFFNIGAGGTVNDIGGSKLNGFMQNILAGGSITNTANDPNFSIAGQVNGFGTLSGPAIVTGGVVANGGKLTVDGTQGGGITVASAGLGTAGGVSDVLDLKGKINFSPSGSFPAAVSLNPGGAVVQLDGATINTTGGGAQIQTGTGTFNVASGTNTLNGSLVANGSNGKVADYTIQSGATLNVQNTNSITPAIAANNFTMHQGSVLTTGAVHNALALLGNFSFQQTDNVNAWNTGGVAGLGPNLIMGPTLAITNGTLAAPTTLEVGGVNEGNILAGYTDNFALDSLSIGAGYVELVDQYSNATPSGWTSGSEALYLDSLFDAPGNKTVGTLNLEGIAAFLLGYGPLVDGLYTDPNGGQINIIGAATILGQSVPEPSTIALLGIGLLGLALLYRRRTA